MDDGDIGITKSAPELLGSIDDSLRRLLSHESDNVELEVEALVSFLNPFQDCPQLLDKRLEEMIQQLSGEYLDNGNQWPMKVLYNLCKIRGEKVVSRFLSSEVHLLPLIHRQLQGSATGQWETRYMLLLWMSILILAPFSLDILDGEGYHSRLYDSVSRYIDVAGKERDGAAVVLARLITRADTSDLLHKFFGNLRQNWNSSLLFRIGTLHCCAIVWRVAKPKQVAPFIPMVMNTIDPESNSESSSKYHKMAAKNLGRMGLTILSTGLEQEYLEPIIDTLLNFYLGYEDTTVRYTAAKAIARMVANLPSEVQPDVIDAILSTFEDDMSRGDLSFASSSKWHGSLLCLAELLRRRILNVDEYLPTIARVLTTSLQFEQKRLTYATGANVRDASCYVCWSLFRVYQDIPAPILDQILANLVVLCCFDREVNIRRAASAAIQEGIGRQNGSPGSLSLEKGLKLIQIVDYLRIGLRSRCFLEISSEVYDLGFQDVVEFLPTVISSWDRDIRKLAASSASVLGAKPGEHSKITDKLFSIYRKDDFEIMHGVLCALGAMLSSVDNEAYDSKAIDILHGITDEELQHENEVLNAEGFLSLFKSILPRRSSELLPLFPKFSLCLELEDPSIVALNIATVSSIPSKMLPQHMIDLWIERMSAKAPYAAYLGALEPSYHSERIRSALANIANHPKHDAAIRKQAVNSIAMIFVASDQTNSQYLDHILQGLDDYTVDARGDVGSWIREICIHWSKQIRLLPNCPADFPAAVDKRLLRICSEPLGRLRVLSCKAIGSASVAREAVDILRGLSELDDAERNGEQYFFGIVKVLNHLEGQGIIDFLKGYVCSAGAIRGSEETLKNSFEALLTYLFEEAAEEKALAVTRSIIALMDVKTYGVRVSSSALRVLHRLLEAGYEEVPEELHNSLFVRAYNLHINTKDLGRINTCTSVFGFLAEQGHEKSIERLKTLCGHWGASVRMSAADALYPVMENETIRQTLENTDWTSPVQQLQEQLALLKMPA
uniref:ARAD1D37004p n=1 Tax=Blastobotrys adeninivorans TaxID=409370 RepID=A0A060TC55_BLAAD